jgi:hypothetical protein
MGGFLTFLKIPEFHAWQISSNGKITFRGIFTGN